VEKCRKCGADLAPRGHGAGRAASYCSVGCRRSTEYDLRRAQDALAAVEKRAREHREHLALAPPCSLNCCGRGEAVQRHFAFLEEGRERLEARMRVLLDDEEARGE
jgi:hypothetical protein